MNRSAWDIGKPDSTTYKINEMYKAKTGRDLDDTSGAQHAGLPRSRRCDQPRRLDRAGQDPAALRRPISSPNS